MKNTRKQNSVTKTGPQINTRPPVVVLLGHVDHGKTTLLDTLASAKIAASEFGEITQSIRALEVDTLFGKITFIDTPGHSYFANLRDKGAKIADIALLVISATEGVREQTVESAELIKKAKIPFICVISKIDLPQANAAVVKTQLAKLGFQLEGEEGQVMIVEVSSFAKIGIDNLIETISILATFEDLKVDFASPAKAVVLESFLDKKAGPTALILVRDGILKTGNYVKVNGISGKIRVIFNQTGRSISQAYPAQPVKILGLEQVIQSGSQLKVTNLAESDSIPQFQAKSLTLADREQAKKQLALILKADSVGSKDAILANLPEGVNLVDVGVGQVTAADVEKVQVFAGKIFGFNVQPTPDAAKLLERQNDRFFSSRLIYELIDEIKRNTTSFVQKNEKVLGMAKILASFDVADNKIAGCRVLEGFLETGGAVKLFRGEKEIGATKIASIKQFAKTITRAKAGGEFGVGFTAPIDFAVGDILKFVA